MRGGKLRHSSSLTLGLSSRCGRDCRYRNLIKTVHDKMNCAVNHKGAGSSNGPPALIRDPFDDPYGIRSVIRTGSVR
ncbi:hypothetical protein C4J65_14490 [Streptomyces sp. CB09001]|nr:hypothetical protein C4J65_14490 [Streptomyces sp. CB09001]